jgi:hypothetical protein
MTMIHCDEVFDILTRGPFPTGAASDGVVESHLTRCGQCRQLAEALRPAIELFQEAVTPEESHGLPSYWGRSCEDTDPSANGEFDGPRATPRPARRGGTRRRDALPAWSFAPVAPWAAAVLVGIALTNWLPRVETSPAAALAGLTKAQDLAKAQWRLEQTPSQWIVQHKVRPACYDPSEQLHAIVTYLNGGDPTANVHLACCKECHAAASPGSKGYVPANELLATCVACHQF